MAARKLHMPGARERIVGSAGAGAVAEGVVVQNGNGGCLQQPPGGSRYETRLATPTVHPLPLASRYVGAMPDSLRPASAALQSTWIQRLRPTSPDVSSRELAHEVAHVWRDPKPPLWNPITPLLLAAPPKEPLLLQPYYREQQQQVDDSGDKRVTVREPVIAPKIIVKTECLDINTSKGWERSQVRVTTGFQTTSAAGQWKHENSWSAPVKPSGFVSNIKGSVVVEGAVRRQGMDSPLEGNSAALMPSSHPLAVNGVSGALVTGFGPLRVVLKPTVGGNMNKSIAAGCSSKLKGPVVEGIQAGDGPSAGAHLVTPIDRNIVKYPAGTQMVTWVAAANTNSTGKFSPDRNMDCEQVGQSSRPGQLFGGGGLVPSKRTGYGSDICKPLFIRPPQPGVRDRTFGCPVNANGNRYEGGFSPVGEVHPMSQTLKGWFPTFSGGGVDMAGRGVAPNQSFATIVSKEGRNDYGQQQEGKYLNRTNPDPSGKQVFGANGIEVRKAKEVMGVAVDRSHVDVGRPQSQGSALSPPFAPYQPSSHMLHIKQQPMSFSPARSPPYRGEEETGTGDEARNDTQERAELKPPFVPPKLPLEGTEGTSGKSAWSSVFAVYKGSNPTGEPQNSNFSTGNLPIDGRPRLHEGQNSVRSRSGGPRASGNQDNENGGSARHIVHAGASSPEVRSQFDNQSSHFSSSPWPVDDGHNPTDDAGSAFGSQASHTPSSPAPRAVQAPGTHLKGQEVSRYRYDLGGSSIVGSKDVSFKRARSKEHSGSQSPGMRNPSGRPEGNAQDFAWNYADGSYQRCGTGLPVSL